MTPNNPTSNNSTPKLELDDRFPSCRWIGFWLQPPIEGQQQTELLLTFSEGVMTGTGFDWVGEFTIKGQYSVETGVCHWIKRYVGSHSVVYHGYNEGKGIWGMWEIRHPFLQLALTRGGFHIWPETMADPTQQHTAVEADFPLSSECGDPVPEPALAKYGGPSGVSTYMPLHSLRGEKD